MANMTFSDRVLNSLSRKLEKTSKNLTAAERAHLRAVVVLGLANARRLKGLKLQGPKPADTGTISEAFATRKLSKSPRGTTFGRTNPGQSCMQRCLAAPQTTFAQCLYWCATR